MRRVTCTTMNKYTEVPRSTVWATISILDETLNAELEIDT